MRAQRPAAAGGDDQRLETLEGVIERVVYHGGDTGFSVLSLSLPARLEPVNAVGSAAAPVAGESVRLHGHWMRHPKFGPQFRFERCETVRPATAQAVEKYLGSGLVRGIGRVMAKRLVARFGAETLDVLDGAPARLREVPGIGPIRAGRLQAAWAEQKAIQGVMLFLQWHGVSASFAVRIYRQYGDEAIRVVEENPYRLARDIWGIGFRTADRIAASLGIARDAAVRLDAGLEYVLLEATDEGHVFLLQEELLRQATETLEVPEAAVAERLAAVLAEQRVVAEAAADGATAIYLPHLLRLEQRVASRLRRLLTAPPAQAPTREQTLRWLQRTAPQRGLALSEQQAEAVVDALREAVLVITGGPGTGKTTVTRTIVAGLEALKKTVLLASPTGRAAKRLSEVTGRPAKTIHRLLEYDPQTHGFKRDAQSPLEADAVIVDEASMLELSLAASLLDAVRDGTQLIVVGDVDQLPSVGAGNVLADAIRSGALPVCRLTEVFRQAAQSRIVRSAHLVHGGRFPDALRGDRVGPTVLSGPPTAEGLLPDCFLLEESDPEALARRVVALVATDLPELGFPPTQTQVLSPLHRGPLGVGRLNELLQRAVNPARAGQAEFPFRAQTFRVGDRVLQQVNNYDKGVFNGDIGVVSAIQPEEQSLVVAFPEVLVSYDPADLDQLHLAYALSIHKSQGSEYEAAVVVMHSSHYIMLQRNLLYTALTRAKRLAVLIGEQKAIWRAVRNDRQTERRSRLAARLRGDLSDGALAPELPF